jgi:hypothetical protein
MPKTKRSHDDAYRYMLGELNALQEYLRKHWPPAGDGKDFVSHATRHGYATPVSRATELLDRLRALEQAEARRSEFQQKEIDQDHHNAVKIAVARILRGHSPFESFTVEELQRQALEMVADAKFWNELLVLEGDLAMLRKLLGKYF